MSIVVAPKQVAAPGLPLLAGNWVKPAEGAAVNRSNGRCALIG